MITLHPLDRAGLAAAQQGVTRIETVLRSHHASARVWQVKVRPRFVQFDIASAFSKRLASIPGLAEELADALGTHSARVYQSGGVLHVEAPQPSRSVGLSDLCRDLADVPQFAGVLGLAEDATPLLLRLDDPDNAHLSIIGAAGSGKTALLRTLVISLAMYTHPGMLQLVLIDPNGRGLGPLGALSHVWRSTGVVQEPAAAVDLLDALADEMQRRAALNRRLPRIVVAIDDYSELARLVGRIRQPLQRLLTAGPASGIHVLVASRQPINGLAWPARVIGAVSSARDAEAASGIPHSRAEALLGRGDFVQVVRDQVVHFQAAYADTRELVGLVAQVRAGGRRRRRWSQG